MKIVRGVEIASVVRAEVAVGADDGGLPKRGDGGDGKSKLHGDVVH